MKIKKMTEDIYTSRENENLRATVAQQAATIDYIAMMADVEIPVEEEKMQKWEVLAMSNTVKVVHSKNYEKFKGYYESGFWTASMVRNAVVKGKITAEEYKEITGEEYRA